MPFRPHVQSAIDALEFHFEHITGRLTTRKNMKPTGLSTSSSSTSQIPRHFSLFIKIKTRIAHYRPVVCLGKASCKSMDAIRYMCPRPCSRRCCKNNCTKTKDHQILDLCILLGNQIATFKNPYKITLMSCSKPPIDVKMPIEL